jgi:UDP-N-acetylmuramoyl-tripeptide--D-alanyl-D-alanine ligase
MFKEIKERSYFLLANYFAFWAKFVLKRWQPTVILITGSSGKTTVFSLLKTQLVGIAEFAENANSAFGLPFAILGLKRQTFNRHEWFSLFLYAPFQAWRVQHSKRFYLVEADVDRPHEGSFLANLLKPDYVFLVSLSHTHAQRFDKTKNFPTVQDAITHEFFEFVRAARQHIYLDGDNKLINQTIKTIDKNFNINSKFCFFHEKNYLQKYSLDKTQTTFVIKHQSFTFPYLLPRSNGLGIVFTKQLLSDLALPFDPTFPGFKLPPGRSNLLRGIKNSLLIDSSYNANLDSMQALLQLFALYPSSHKWVVLGYLLEQGQDAPTEHLKLARAILKLPRFERYIFIGSGNQTWTVPYLKTHGLPQAEFFADPKDALQTIAHQLRGGEVLLLKGAPFIEGIVEGLLADPRDAQFLVRREPAHKRHRAKFYGKTS